MKGNCWMGCGKEFETTKEHQNNNLCPKCFKKMLKAKIVSVTKGKPNPFTED